MSIDYKLWQEDNYPDVFPMPEIMPDGSTTATEEELRRLNEYRQYSSCGIPPRPDGWKFDYSVCSNVTDENGVLLTPILDPHRNYKNLWESFKAMQKEQPKIGHTGQHGAINQEWWQTQVNKELK